MQFVSYAMVTCEIKLFQNYFSLIVDVRLKWFYFSVWKLA